MWTQTVGIVNGSHKYLTAETFGFKINANGVGLKKKQLWTIEPYPLQEAILGDELAEQEHVAIKSHLDCYLAVDQFGNVTCESKEMHPGARFTITICSMSAPTIGNNPGGDQIYWAFRNVERGYFLGCQSDGMISCSAKIPQSRSELWLMHLVPARGSTWFSLKSLGRKRSARTVPCPFNNDQGGKEQVQMDSNEAWGPDTLFQFKYFEGGRYALLTSTCKYVSCEGFCVDWNPGKDSASGKGDFIIPNGKINVNLPPQMCLFTIEYHGGSIAFRDFQGQYLAGTGRSAILRSRSNTVSRDELFQFEPAPIQVALRAQFNGRFVSVKQGYDVSANQNDISNDHETFSLEYDVSSDVWFIRTKEGNYWAPGAASAIQASSNDKRKAGSFNITWNEDGTCSLASGDQQNVRFVCARKSGQLCFGSTDPIGFHMMFRNRRSLNLRPSNGSGFVGLKQLGLGKIECNKTAPDSLLVEYANSDLQDDVIATYNCCYFKMPLTDKYWSVVDGSSIACDSSSVNCAQQFVIELRTGFTIAIRTFDSSSYLNLTKQGTVGITPCAPSEATLWEF